MLRTLPGLLLLSSGCTLVDPLEGYAGGRPTGTASYEARCAAAGVIRCYGFDSGGDLERYYVAPASGSPADIDTAVKTSGAGSLRFRFPANPTSGNLGGLFGINFDDDWDVSAVEGESVYVQWRERFGAAVVDGDWVRQRLAACLFDARRRDWGSDSDSPCTYSMTRNSSPPSATTSSIGTTLGWMMRDERRASSTNIATKSACLANCGCRRLIATVREKPTGPRKRPRYTVAMPPDASS